MRVLDLPPERWLNDAELELENAARAWATGNAGMGRVGARRAAGMALKAWLGVHPQPDYGQSYMHHLNALADDARQPSAQREAAWRLSARPQPAGGFAVPPPPALTPMMDARALMDWAAAQAGLVAAG